MSIPLQFNGRLSIPAVAAPMFLVSTEVTAIYGEAECISGAKTCQLLSFEEGFPVTFVYGENDVRYKINLIKAEPIVTGKT